MREPTRGAGESEEDGMSRLGGRGGGSWAWSRWPPFEPSARRPLHGGSGKETPAARAKAPRAKARQARAGSYLRAR